MKNADLIVFLVVPGIIGAIIGIVVSAYAWRKRKQFEMTEAAPDELTVDQKRNYLHNKWFDEWGRIIRPILAVGLPIILFLSLATPIVALIIANQTVHPDLKLPITGSEVQPSEIESSAIASAMISILQMATTLLFIGVLILIIVRFKIVRRFIDVIKGAYGKGPSRE
jgi:hypothetical protein